MSKSELERLASIEAKLDGLDKQFSNHLKHHWAIELLLLAAVVGFVVKMFL